MIPVALSVAGSDPSGGAGIQADLRTFSRLNVYGMSVISALTAQNTAGVRGVLPIDAEFVGRQWDAAIEEHSPQAVKTGMLANAGIVKMVAAKMRRHAVNNVVVDPVMISTSGTPLLEPSAIQSMKRDLIPLALIITPNLDEARTLSGVEVQNKQGMEEAARRIHDFGARFVLVKGGHLPGGDAMDVLFDGKNFHYLHAERIPVSNVHGTGCVLSAAIAAYLARGYSVEDAVKEAKAYISEEIGRRLRPNGKPQAIQSRAGAIDMTTIPLIEQQVADDFMVLNLENVALTDEQFVELCADNSELFFELTAQKELLVMTPPGPWTGRQNEPITTDLANWARQDGTGLTFATGTLFKLPNGAKRGPDASWVKREKWEALGEQVREETVPLLVPDFIVELMSPSDKRPVRFRMLQAKMEEYIANGVRLGWMIDPFQKKVYIYRPDQPVECLENPDVISGEPVLPGFTFNVAEVWR